MQFMANALVICKISLHKNIQYKILDLKKDLR